jgi:hypothetical protein
MTPASEGSNPHVLLFEARTEGHHLPWLRMMIEDLLSGQIRVSVALRQDAETQRFLQAHLGELLRRVPVLPITTKPREPSAGRLLRRAAQLVQESGADMVFFCCLDEVASACLRRAAVGWMPPRTLRGRFGGVFLRPRFLDLQSRTLNQLLKGLGFRRLVRGQWVGPVLFLDEQLCQRALAAMPDGPFLWLPDPPTQLFDLAQADARAALGLPPDKRVFLFYGGPYRRKGLHLAVEALASLPPEHPAFLLYAGLQGPDPKVAAALDRLSAQGRARLLNRYVTDEEEKACFCGCDVVLLPYLKHFGSSGVLAQAAAAGKPVIASDEGLVGYRVRQYGLGWLFPSGDVPALRQAILQATTASQQELQLKRLGAQRYAAQFSRAQFRRHLLQAFSRILGSS